VKHSLRNAGVQDRILVEASTTLYWKLWQFFMRKWVWCEQFRHEMGNKSTRNVCCL